MMIMTRRWISLPFSLTDLLDYTNLARILSIEDDAELQHLIGVSLFKEGYEVHYAFNGKEGLEKIFSLHPDLILLDMMLPILSGVEVIKQVTSNTQTRGIPIIVMTAFTDQANTLEQSLKAQGIREYVQKPFRVTELVSLIGRTIESSPQAPPPPNAISKGGVKLIPQYRTVWINDQMVATLPHKRAELLRALLEAKGAVKREKLLDHLWGPSASMNLLEKTIQRLREDLGPAANRIQTTADGYELVG
jgi:DNA-binding response OmpR family regulator